MTPYQHSSVRSHVISLFWGLGLSLISVFTAQVPAWAEFVPPDRGTPGRLEGAGTRWRDPSQGEFTPPDQPLFDTVRGSCTTTAADASASALTLLAPLDTLGITLEEYPRFFLYVPPLPEGAQLEFAVTEWERLVTEAGDDIRDRQVYLTQVTPPQEGGVMALELPEVDDEGNPITPLAVGQNYTWFVRILCDPDSPTRFGPDIWREAWVRRLAPTEEFASQLAEAPLAEQVGLLAETGVWYDALARLAQLRSQSDEPELEQRWQGLLESIGLEEVAGE
ncbi:DUF928 domain-containing protein [Geitlerinema sp. P-1104]|uniref:DUF928 domain-containing protein n=1 Tax=Geitlerinema sp. P-1104 TaxID=2546230 RepID=UPI0014775156|nr:DUF928 domain-containing protein [Geitlerinema sp. P-1104]NMG58729.1 DUF928 domain-containing protein [Geitlerinema sp. P-1104]